MMKLVANDIDITFWDEISDEVFDIGSRKIKNEVSSSELVATINQVFDYVKENRNENSKI